MKGGLENGGFFESDATKTGNRNEENDMDGLELRWIMGTMFNVAEFKQPETEDTEVNLYEHFGWQGLTHDDDVADLSPTEITEQGLNVNLRRVNY